MVISPEVVVLLNLIPTGSMSPILLLLWWCSRMAVGTLSTTFGHCKDSTCPCCFWGNWTVDACLALMVVCWGVTLVATALPLFCPGCDFCTSPRCWTSSSCLVTWDIYCDITSEYVKKFSNPETTFRRPWCDIVGGGSLIWTGVSAIFPPPLVLQACPHTCGGSL